MCATFGGECVKFCSFFPTLPRLLGAGECCGAAYLRRSASGQAMWCRLIGRLWLSRDSLATSDPVPGRRALLIPSPSRADLWQCVSG